MYSKMEVCCFHTLKPKFTFRVSHHRHQNVRKTTIKRQLNLCFIKYKKNEKGRKEKKESGSEYSSTHKLKRR
jgi:hypothetical protein